MSDTPARPTFTAPEAVAATGKSRRQIGRMLAAGELVGAHKTAGEWQIPLEALLAAGLRLHAPSPPDAPSSTTTPPDIHRDPFESLLLEAS